MNFRRVTSSYRFLFLLVFSAALMIVDHRSQLLAPMRVAGSVINVPFQFLFSAPAAISSLIAAYYPDDSLHRKYQALQNTHSKMLTQLQRIDALKADNQRLAELLSRRGRADPESLLADIIDIGLDPFTQRVALNRGVESGVYLGQPVVTSQGVLGQVSGLGVNHCVVTLLTHPKHSIPVQIQRNGVRAIAQGRGGANRVAVPFLPGQTDIRHGDILVTSGLGGRFPVGYKVAQVREIITDADEAFLTVNATSFVNIGSTAETLLLWSGQPDAPPLAP